MTIAHNLALYTINLLNNITAAADKMTIGQMVDEAYLCLLDTPWDLPVRKYTRKAQVIADLAHIVSRINACPAFAEPVPDVTPEAADSHYVHAAQLVAILKCHGIGPQDWDAVMDYLACSGHPLKYFTALYVDYVYEVTPFCPDEGCPHSDIVHYCNITPNNPEDAPMAKVLEDVINHGIGVFSADLEAGLTVHHALERVILGAPPSLADEALRRFSDYSSRTVKDWWHPIRTDQEARAILTKACNVKPEPSNRFPRGKCAQRMLSLGWVFNH